MSVQANYSAPRVEHRRRLQPVPRNMRLPASVANKERFLSTEVGDKELEMLIELIRYDGIKDIAKAIGISDLALLRVCSGFIDRCRPKTQHAVRRFFALGPSADIK